MGPNGSGKSTLSSVLAGRDDYEVTDGEVIYMGQNLLDLEPEERAWAGVFLSSILLKFQASKIFIC